MKKLLAITAAVVLLASTSPLAAFTLVERGSTFEIQVKFDRTALIDANNSMNSLQGRDLQDRHLFDGGRLRPCDVHQQQGPQVGEAHGIIAVRPGAASPAAGAPGAPNATQKVQQAGAEASIDFVKAGFNGRASTSFASRKARA